MARRLDVIQAIIWTSDGILLIAPLGTSVSEILIGIHTFSFKQIHLKMSSAKWRPFCLGLNGLITKNTLCVHYWAIEYACGTMTSSIGTIFRINGPLCREFTGHRWIPLQRPVTRSFDVAFNLSLNKRLSKQSWDWWFETPSHSLWRDRDGFARLFLSISRFLEENYQLTNSLHYPII